MGWVSIFAISQTKDITKDEKLGSREIYEISFYSRVVLMRLHYV